MVAWGWCFKYWEPSGPFAIELPFSFSTVIRFHYHWWLSFCLVSSQEMCPKVHADMEMAMARTGDTAKTNGDWEKRIQKFAQKVKRYPGLLWQKIWKLGREDPRRVIHSLKVGISLTLVSLLYLLEPLFMGIGQNAIWAVMTVVLVLEFTVG